MAEPNALKKLIGESDKFLKAVGDYYKKDDFQSFIRAECEEKNKQLASFDPDADYSSDDSLKYLQALDFFARKEEYSVFLSHSYARYPDTPELKCLMLLARLEKTEDPGEKVSLIAELETLARQLPMLIYLLNDALLLYYLEHGDNEKIKSLFDLRDSAVPENERLLEAKASANDDLIIAPLNDASREKIVKEFSKFRIVRSVYAVQRRYDGVRNDMIFLLVVPRKFCISGKPPNQAVDELSDIFPECRVERIKDKFAKVLDEIPGACIYDRKKAKS